MLLRNSCRISAKSSQSGNIFFAIFGAIALVGLLGAAMMTFMKGPLSTAVKLTKINSAETQMTIGAQVAVMSTTSQANSGDCDSDGFVEPQPWRAATTEPIPTNGGLIPLSLGISKKDPWGTEYGYCVWNHGAVTSGGTCGANMLTGTNSTAYPVVAIVSAGPDKAFTTTCRTFASADTNSDGDLDDAGDHPLISKAAETDDDIIQTFTYEEATAASGGLWSLKSGDPTTAVISKKIEATGTAEFQGGVLLPDSSLITCDATTAGVMAKNASGTGIEICDGAGSWATISGGSGATDSFTGDMAAVCNAGNVGKVRYNSTTSQPEFCNGTSWLPFTLSPPTGSLIILPTYNYSMDITGPCSGGNCPYAYTSWTTFTVYNKSNTATGVLTAPSITGTGSSNFEIDAATSTCDDAISLNKVGTAGDSCVVKLRAKASGNASYSANLVVTTGAVTAVAPLYGVASGFTCQSGTYGWGGHVVGACAGAGGTEPSIGQLIVQEPGCSTSTSEPACTGNSSNDPVFASVVAVASGGYFNPNTSGTSDGQQNDANLQGYYGTYPASVYCRNLVKNGYSDWFLPTLYEYGVAYSDPVMRAKFTTASSYMTSQLAASELYYGDQFYYFNFAAGATSSTSAGGTGKIRCMRRYNYSPSMTITPDTTPTFGYASPQRSMLSSLLPLRSEYTSNLSTLTTSTWQLQVLSFNTSMTMTVSGSGSPQFRVNGGAWQTSGTLTPTSINLIDFRATSPATYGAENAIAVSIGTVSGNWKIRTYDPTVNKNIFVTSTSYTGNMGGLSGANTICQTRAAAAGLSQASTYRALLSTSTGGQLSNLGWNWNSLRNMAGQTVFANPSNFERLASISNGVGYTEFGVATGSTKAWTGAYGNTSTSISGFSADPTVPVTYGPYTCSDFTSTASGIGIHGSTTNATSLMSFWSTSACSTSMPIFCAGPNPDLPGATACPGAVNTTASKSVAGSYNVTVPANCKVTFKMWGGAGGKGGYNAVGGGGGYSYFSETPSVDTTYYYSVGGNGTDNGTAGGSSAAGFAGGTGCSSGNVGIGGGGASVLYRNSVSSANLIAVAAGGGGGAYYATGGAGDQSTNTYSTTVTAGGNGTCSGGSGVGGGGGGYDGATGGGGDARTGSGLVGYGGKNWVATGAGIISSTSAGSGAIPGNNGDSDRPSGAGCGGSTNCSSSASNSNPGAIVVIY